MKKWSPIIIGLILIVGSCVFFVKFMKSYQLDVTMMKTIRPVHMIQAGELITSDMLEEVSIPTVQHMPNAIIDKNLIVGKRAIVPIGEMEEVLSWKIGENTLYPAADETYIGFKVDFVTAVNNMVRRGDKIDVWVEYMEPKLYDASGREIDSEQVASGDSVEIAKKVYNDKLISGLTVAYIKDQEGKEIEDTSTVNNSFSLPLSADQRDVKNIERYRQETLAQPAYITFIMNDYQYSKFAEGQKEGAIKLALPNFIQPVGTIVPTNSPQDQSNQLQNQSVQQEGGEAQ
ncbi:SAF domain-containing protein [Paenibacillus sp. MMO-177]|uniref:SAF domain-containing protein n=1 Tax=Paenibacillus sp. MMO-177 TaxID=3081289 RepID=UPI003016A340